MNAGLSATPSVRPCLSDLSHVELCRFVESELGERCFRADQIFRWLHGRGAGSFSEMTDLGRELRGRLEAAASLTSLRVDAVETSTDGTRKLRLRLGDGQQVECVLIPDGRKLTLCVSSQVGCAIGCRFCATAHLGLRRNLHSGEIVGQVCCARAYAAEHLAREQPGRITNLVFMGMGEPLANYRHVVRALAIITHPLGANLSSRRITLSTVGLVPGIERLGGEPLQVNLAVSLAATTDQLRGELVPLARRYPLPALIAAIRRYPLERRRRVTFEYLLLEGLNDTPDDAIRLGRLLRGIPSKLNLIGFNPHPFAAFPRTSEQALLRFQESLRAAGLPVYLRKSRGQDIAAACGQLAAAGGQT